MFGLHFRYAKAFQNSPCNDSRKFTNLMRLMDAGWYRKQKAIGEDLWVTVWWYRGTLLQDSGSPILSQFSTPSEGGPRSRGREEVGDVVDDSCLGRQYLLDRSFGPVTIFLSHFVYHVWPKNLGHKTVQLDGLTISPLFLLWSLGKCLTRWVIYLRAYFCTCCCSFLKAYQN